MSFPKAQCCLKPEATSASFSGAWCHSLRCGRGHVDGFFPPRALRCLDFSEPRRGGQAGPANLKLFLEEGRAAFAVLWNPNAFSCRPDKITGLLSRQRSDFPRNQPRSPGSSRLAVRSLRVSAVKPDSLPGMHTRPSCDRAGPFRPTTPDYPYIPPVIAIQPIQGVC